MDLDGFTLEQIRIQLQTIDRLADLQARRHIAVLAVALTTAAGSLGALIAGQLGAPSAAAIALAAILTVLRQVDALDRLAEQLRRGRAVADAAIERMKKREVQQGVDERAP